MKHQHLIYLESEDYVKLIEKAKESGFTGRGALIKYLEKIAREPICFLDSNVKMLLQTLQLKLVRKP